MDAGGEISSVGRSGEPTFLDARDGIWSLYLESAEKRGKSRLEQWKGDTDGILIFTGLFAATVATFVVSTLPSLSPDSGSQTVNLLAQVLAVLANNSETSHVNLTAAIGPSVFEVPRSAIQVNTLWLISLCLSLSSALAATLVQQWARTYIRDAHRHTKVVTRGLVHAALEYGIARFRMEHSAAAIMFLLHASVFLFYAGLLVLLFSTNAVIAQILAALMGIGGFVYFVVSAGVNTVAAFYVDTEHLPVRLRPESDLAKLLLMLGITDYKDIGIKKSRLDGLHPLPLFSAVHPRYQQLFRICPELAHMLHSLCVMLVERRDVSKIYPFFNAAPPRTTMPYELRLASPISNSRTDSPIINRFYTKPIQYLAHAHDTVALDMLDHTVLASNGAAAVQQWEDVVVSTRRNSSPRSVMLAQHTESATKPMPTMLAIKDVVIPAVTVRT
ncbi:hypothetical protein PENSPDRAFT_753875 [Peniophora sp. CONT]|nr:hypothetical protein PENSPDRAFT_753875 [Peniophora sp. CONT]